MKLLHVYEYLSSIVIYRPFLVQFLEKTNNLSRSCLMQNILLYTILALGTTPVMTGLK